MKKALVTAAGPNMQDILACSEPTFQQFADTHGYELIVEHNVDDSPQRNDAQARAARWAKVGLLSRVLEDYDLAVWMDADAMFTRFDKDIADDFDENCFQAFVLEQFPTRFNPNSGVWCLRGGPLSKDFLETIQTIGQVGTIFADQGAICSALGWEVDGESGKDIFAKPVHYSKFLAGTGWLPPEWNPLGQASRWPSRVQHFAGMKHEERLPRMQALQAQLVESGILK